MQHTFTLKCGHIGDLVQQNIHGFDAKPKLHVVFVQIIQRVTLVSLHLHTYLHDSVLQQVSAAGNCVDVSQIIISGGVNS